MLYRILIFCLLVLPANVYASFIEATMGTAVVNDATATYHNPAAMTLIKNTQMVGLGSYADFRTAFTGDITQTRTGFTQSGRGTTHTNYYLPSAYWVKPATENLRLGIGLISNFFNDEIDGNSILRYAKPNNSIQNMDLVTSLGYKFNEYFALGAGLNISYANFTLDRVSGFPTLHIPDAQSESQCDGTAISGDIGILLKPRISTLIGFNYHGRATYHLSGSSFLSSIPPVASNHFNFTFWTPARTVLTISQLLSKTSVVFATAQYIQWSVIDTIHMHNVAAQVGKSAMIINADQPSHLRNSWIVTLGGNIKPISKWVIRGAVSYVETPGSGNYSLSNGNSIILGTSIGYALNKQMQLDGGYSHAFMQDKSIHIVNPANTTIGTQQGWRDAFSLKLTYNV